TSLSFETSARIACPLICADTASIAIFVLPVTITFAPAAANRSAMVFPIPEPPPVTNAILPFKDHLSLFDMGLLFPANLEPARIEQRHLRLEIQHEISNQPADIRADRVASSNAAQHVHVCRARHQSGQRVKVGSMGFKAGPCANQPPVREAGQRVLCETQ